MSLLRGVPIMGKRVKRGMSVRFTKANKEDGLGGERVRTIVYNDDYTPNLARRNITEFLKEQYNIILLPVGSPTFDSYIDFV